MNVTIRRGGAAFVGAVLLTVAGACSNSAGDPESPEQVLLDRAIAAVWGDHDPTSIKSIRRVSRVSSHDSEQAPSSEIEVIVDGPNHYREVRRRPYGITEVFAINGDEAWASIDDTLVPLDEDELANRRLQPWLFEISKLAPLKDTDKFGLRHLGREVLDSGITVEKLRVRPHDNPELELTLSFRVDDWLAHRVMLNKRVKREELALVFDDYRKIDGVQVAHEILAYRGDRLVATQHLQSVEFDIEADSSQFSVPVVSNRDRIFEKDESVSGFVACARHEGSLDELFDTVDDLKEWITESELAIAGPLVVMRDESELPTSRESDVPVDRHLVCVVINPPDGAKPFDRLDRFGTARLEPQRVLSLTHVGADDNVELLEQLSEAAAERRLEITGPPFEILFSADRQIRQLQLPIK